MKNRKFKTLAIMSSLYVIPSHRYGEALDSGLKKIAEAIIGEEIELTSAEIEDLYKMLDSDEIMIFK